MKKKLKNGKYSLRMAELRSFLFSPLILDTLYYQAAIDRAISLVNIELLKMSEQRESVEKPFESFDSILQQFSYPPPSMNQR